MLCPYDICGVKNHAYLVFPGVTLKGYKLGSALAQLNVPLRGSKLRVASRREVIALLQISVDTNN